MYKNELPFIFDRRFKSLSNKAVEVKKYNKPMKYFPSKFNYSDDRLANIHNKYVWRTKGLNSNSNSNNFIINTDKKNNASQSHWTINIIIPKKRDIAPIIREHNDFKKDIIINEENANNMFLTKCNFYGNTSAKKTMQYEINKEDIFNSQISNLSDIGLLLKELEINKEKIDIEREDLEKMIKSTKHTHEKITGLTRYGLRFYNLHNNNSKYKKSLSAYR